MNVNKLDISPIYTIHGISKKVGTINMKNLSGEDAGKYIKERLYLRDEQPVVDVFKPIDLKDEVQNQIAKRAYRKALNTIDDAMMRFDKIR